MEGGINQALLPSKKEEVEGDLRGRIGDESKKIWKIAFPGILARVSTFGCIIVTQSFIGHISAKDLAGYALVQTLSVRFANGVLIGMSSATETLCGQAYGAGQYHMMGIYLQRSWIVDLITSTIMLPIFLFGTSIFRLLGQEEDIAVAAGHTSLLIIPTMYSFVFALTIQMYLQAQQRNAIVAWIAVLQFIIHIPLSWLFVIVLNMGVGGAMAAINISSWLSVIMQLVFVLGGWCPETWKGFTTAAFKDLWPVVKLSVSSGFMTCLELWYTAVLVLLAGYMKNAAVAISAFSICLNVHGWELMVTLGFLGSACVRVANELGRGDAKAVKFSIKMNAATSMIIAVKFFVLVLVFGHKIGYFFTTEKDVAEYVSSLSIILAFAILLNGLYPVLSGVAVGAGLQGTVALISLVSYYVIGIPLGVVLGYVAHLQVKGIWIGMIIGMLVQTFALSYMIWKTNWDKEVEKALDRLRRWYLKSPEDFQENSDQINTIKI